MTNNTTFVERGIATDIRYDAPKEEKERVIEDCIKAACNALPQGAVFDIRGKVRPTKGSGTTKDLQRYDRQIAQYGIAWYSNALMQEDKTTYRHDFDSAPDCEEGGYVKIARGVVGKTFWK